MNGYVLETQHPDAASPGGVRTARWVVVASSPIAAQVLVRMQGARIIQSGPDVLTLARSLGVPDNGYKQI